MSLRYRTTAAARRSGAACNPRSRHGVPASGGCRPRKETSMSKIIGPACKLCRREGDKLFLKGTRCLRAKCAFERRAFAPGAARQGCAVQAPAALPTTPASCARSRRRAGCTASWKRSSAAITRRRCEKRGLTGLNLLQLLESRLDNVVYRLGFAESRAKARVLVTHGHFNVNGRRTDVPSYVGPAGRQDRSPRGSRTRTYFKGLAEAAESRTVPTWINRDLRRLCPEASESCPNGTNFPTSA